MNLPTPPVTDDQRLNDILNFIYRILLTLQPNRQTNVSANYTALLTDHLLLVDTSAPITITLPPLTSAPKEFRLIIKDATGGAGANNITIDGDGAETIDGAATEVISANYDKLRLVKANDNSQWLTW